MVKDLRPIKLRKGGDEWMKKVMNTDFYKWQEKKTIEFYKKNPKATKWDAIAYILTILKPYFNKYDKKKHLKEELLREKNLKEEPLKEKNLKEKNLKEKNLKEKNLKEKNLKEKNPREELNFTKAK